VQQHPQDEYSKLHDRALLAAVEAQGHGRYELALDLYEEALGHAEALDNRRKIHGARINISSCLLSLGEHDNARRGLPAIILESDEPRHICVAAYQLADAFLREGRFERSKTYLKTSLDQARQCGDLWHEGLTMLMQGHLEVLSGDHAGAVESYDAARVLHESVQDAQAGRSSLCSIMDNLGYAELLTGDLAKGLRHLHVSKRLAIASGNLRVEAEAEKDLAFGFLLGDKLSAAERHGAKALGLATDHGYDTVLRNACYLLMEISLRQDRDRDFEGYFDRLQSLMPEMKLSRDFFRMFDISDVINLKEF
jgi:tetratricopeptide (TPR) repeat protein